MGYLSKIGLIGWVFLSLPILVLIGLVANSVFIVSILAMGAGSFTLNSSFILLLCIGLGAIWNGSQQNLAYCLIGANIAYRIYVYAFILPDQYTRMGEQFSPSAYSIFLTLLGSSYFALIIGFATLKSVAFLRAEFGKPKNGEG